jgi:hypothetical protein
MKKTFSMALAWLLLLNLSLSACAAPGTAPELPYIDTSPTDGGTGDNPTIPPEVVQPPSITVFTEFPSGTVWDPAMDVTYEAIPSTGAFVTGVYYTINDGFPNYIYLEGENGRGELGQGNVLLQADENIIVFVVEDSSGQTAQFEVAEHPVFDIDNLIPPPDNPDKIMPSEHGDYSFVINRIGFMAQDDVSYAQVEQVVSDIGGVILTFSSISGRRGLRPLHTGDNPRRPQAATPFTEGGLTGDKTPGPAGRMPPPAASVLVKHPAATGRHPLY